MSGRPTEVRPWGAFEVLYEDRECKVKRILVERGKRVSYQTHAQRAEHWLIVSGTGEVTLDGVRSPVSAGSAVDVPHGCAHRIENTGAEKLVFVEVQHGGTYFGEDDIVRIDDDFGRVEPS